MAIYGCRSKRSWQTNGANPVWFDFAQKDAAPKETEQQKLQKLTYGTMQTQCKPVPIWAKD